MTGEFLAWKFKELIVVTDAVIVCVYSNTESFFTVRQELNASLSGLIISCLTGSAENVQDGHPILSSTSPGNSPVMLFRKTCVTGFGCCGTKRCSKNLEQKRVVD